MTQIKDENTFRAALRGLDGKAQRVVAARFVERVLPLCDDAKVAQAVAIAGDSNASRMDLAEAFKAAKAGVLHNRARYGSEGNWRKQAGYFVARATVAALSPRCQMPEGVAWHAALSSRLARASEAINNGDNTDGQEREEQYQILAGLLTV